MSEAYYNKDYKWETKEVVISSHKTSQKIYQTK